MDGDIPAPSEVIDELTDPVTDATGALGDTLQAAIRELSDAVRIQTDMHAGNRDALGRIEGNLAEIVNRLNETVADAADAAIESVEDAAEVAADAPVAGADAVEAVIEEASAAPARKPRGLVGHTRRGKRRS